MRRWVSVLVLLLVGCGGAGWDTSKAPTDAVEVRVESWNFYATRVRVFCDGGTQLGVVRGLVLGSSARKRVRLAGCHSLSFQVGGGGLQPWRSWIPLPVSGGDTVQGRLEGNLDLSSFWIGPR